VRKGEGAIARPRVRAAIVLAVLKVPLVLTAEDPLHEAAGELVELAIAFAAPRKRASSGPVSPRHGRKADSSGPVSAGEDGKGR
jgi:hypothetical protein